MEERKLKFIDATEDYYESIKQLCDDSFGTGYIDRREYEKWLLNPGLFNVALIDDDFAGFSVMIPAGVEDIMKHMGMEKAEVLAMMDHRPALIYKSVAVRSIYRKNGLLAGLIKALLFNAKDLGYGSVFLSAWTYGGKTPVANSLMSLNFSRLYERHMLWHHNENYRCVICDGRCGCDAVIYYKNL